MYLPFSASKLRQREAQNARNNRAEIVRALGAEQITKRDLIRWGIYTTGGMLAMKNGLSPYARSAFAQGATGAPRSPLNGAQKFKYSLDRLRYTQPSPLKKTLVPGAFSPDGTPLAHADFLNHINEPSIKRRSYHTDFTDWQRLQPKFGNPSFPGLPDAANPYVNQLTHRGPMEGRPPGEMFSHQRWDEFFPQQGYIMSLSQCGGGTYFHHDIGVNQQPNACWCYGDGAGGDVRGSMPPPLLKLRYGEPAALRVYNNLPTNKLANGGFGRNESQLHFHNAHNGAESDGAANVHHFPGTFYDYRWSTTLARRDTINIGATDPRASGPDGSGGLINVAGDWRELQGTLWAHDHRFFFTAENVYKGNLMMINMYSGRDRGHEGVLQGPGSGASNDVNLRLPSGTLLDYGNLDFDVNLVISDGATDQQGQYFFDIFTTDGFIGDMPLVNFQYGPYMEVLPRRYRFRLLNASMSRFIKLAIAQPNGTPLPFHFIANDGNFVISPIRLTQLDEQGIAERYDIVVDFSGFLGQSLHLVNLLQQTDGRKPDKALSMADALAGNSSDPVVGALMQFRVVSSVASVDEPTAPRRTLANSPNPPMPLLPLTAQIPIIAPVRTRTVEFGRGNGDSRQGGGFGTCTPDCSEVVQDFPWIIKINGQASHSMNANRISLLVPKPGEVEHWTYINGGGGWDHPIHLHFEEGITMNRGNDTIPDTEKLVRKDVWRLRPAGQVTFQIQFGEFGGSYVNHCHNTVHEDFAMLMRIQLLGGERTQITATPNPTQDGVIYTAPEIQPEGDPRVSSGPTSNPGGGTSGGGSSGGGGRGRSAPNNPTTGLPGGRSITSSPSSPSGSGSGRLTRASGR